MNILKNIISNLICKSNKNDIISCQFGYKRLYFRDRKILYCPNGNPYKNRAFPIVCDNFNGQLDIEKLAKKLRTDRNIVIGEGKGKLPICEGCNLIKDVYIKEKTKKYPHIEFIQFSDWSLCNSQCIYCESWKKKCNVSDDSYDIMPIIEILEKQNMITSDTAFEFAGGEPTIYRQFNEALNFLLKLKVKHIEVFTNAINYSECIEAGLKNGSIKLTISIDAGSKEIHRIMKGVDTYDIVYSNMQKYTKSQKYKDQVISKYVIVPNINDIESEIELWIKKSKQVGVNKAIINCDDRILQNEISNDLVLKINNLSDFFISKAQEYKLNYDILSNIRFITNKLK